MDDLNEDLQEEALTPEKAQELLAAAEAALEFAERPKWDLEHAQIDFNVAAARLNGAGENDDKEPLEKALEAATAKRDEAKAVFDAHPATGADIDRAAQAVIHGREALARAKGE